MPSSVGSEANHRSFALAAQHRVAIEGAGFGGATSEGVHGGIVSVRPNRVFGIVRKRAAETVGVTVVTSRRVRGSRYRDAQRENGRVVEVCHQPTLSQLVPHHNRVAWICALACPTET